MRIIQITASYKPAYLYGGPIRSVAKLCEGLCEFDKTLETAVFTTTANGKDELAVPIAQSILVDGVPVTYFKRYTKDHTHFAPSLLWHLHKVLRHTKAKETIVHIHSWWNLVSILSCLIAKINRIPVVLTPRGMLTSYTFGNRNSISKRLIHQLLGKKLLTYCHIHATSLKEQVDILNITTPKSSTIIPNLIHIPAQTSPIINHKKVFKIIFLSRVEEKKGLEFLFDALAELEIDWALTIAGAGKEQYINGLKERSAKICPNITWIGQISDEAKFDLLADHDLMALTSYNENFANVVLESLSVGTAVLLTKGIGLADYIAEKQLGWVCEQTVNDIKVAIIQAHHDRIQRNHIRETAPIQIRADFADAKLIKQYSALYHHILKS